MEDGTQPLFKRGDFANEVDLDWIDDKEWAFVEGFRDAAAIVAERALQSRATGRWLFYPIAFLFRHGIELQLKRLLSLLDRREGVPKNVRRIHSLGRLWGELQPRLGQYMQEAWVDDSTQIARVMAELEEQDPDGQEARYPHSARGEAFKDVAGIDLRHFAAVASEAVSTLIGIEAHLDEVFEFNDEQQAEFEAEFRAEMQGEYGY